jgi:hypothetical protein
MKRTPLTFAVLIAVYVISVIAAALVLASADAATTGITDRLSADHTSIEVTSEPTGTARIHVAIMQNLSGSGVKYLDISAAQLKFTPPIADPVVDVIAETSSGATIGSWAGRIQTTPGGVKEEPPKEKEPPSAMVVGIDAGGWRWESAIADFSGAVKYVRSSYTNYNSDSQMALLAKYGVHLMPLFFEGGSMQELDTASHVETVVNWCRRYCKGGAFWAGKTDLGATTIELVNEPGNPYLHGGEPRSESSKLAYVDLTRKVHAALAPISPLPKLLASFDGGFEGDAYGRWIFAHGAVADGVTVHPYGGKSNVEQSALGGRKRVTEAHEQAGKPVYVTEIGWPTAVGQPATGDSLQWTEQQQAENIVNWVHWCRSLGYVAATVNFNLVDYGTNNWYGIDRKDLSHKPSYAALKGA